MNFDDKIKRELESNAAEIDEILAEDDGLSVGTMGVSLFHSW